MTSRADWRGACASLGKRLINEGLEKLGTLLLVFGLVLLALGVAIQMSRGVRLRTAESARPAPSFAMSVRRTALPVSTGPSEEERAAARPVRLVMESIGLDTPVVGVGWEARVVNGEFAGNEWQTADNAAGFHTSSAPAGMVGNTVISGHNNLGGAVFRDLYKADIGDLLTLRDASGRQYDYQVVESFVTREVGASASERRDNTQWIRPSPDERVTLISCFPPWSNTHRIIVVAFPVAQDGSTLTPAPPGPPAHIVR